MAEQLYSTTDFYSVAMLISMKFPIHSITPVDQSGRVKRFHFLDSKELRETILSYTNGTLTGNIKDFKNAIESVKDLVHGS